MGWLKTVLGSVFFHIMQSIFLPMLKTRAWEKFKTCYSYRSSKKCKIYLYRRPFGVFGEHWALLFEFEDGKRIFLEATENQECLLVYSYHYDSEEMSKYEWVTTLLRRIELSERLLDESVSKKPLNSTSYSFLTNNTQHWVKELAKALDIQINRSIFAGYLFRGLRCVGGQIAILLLLIHLIGFRYGVAVYSLHYFVCMTYYKYRENRGKKNNSIISLFYLLSAYTFNSLIPIFDLVTISLTKPAYSSLRKSLEDVSPITPCFPEEQIKQEKTKLVS